jgi:hypothetical protein
MPTLKLGSHVPVANEPSHTALPAKGPSWLIAPTKHADEVVGYDDDTISIPHYESGRLFPYFRETIRGSELGGLEAIDQRLATAAAHYAAGEDAFGGAIADLCVTGRESFRQLGPRNVDDAVDWARVESAVRSAAVLPETKTRRMIEGRAPLPAPGPDHVKRAIERAQKVHAYLRASEKERALLRPGLGWVAVSGEDDLPLRPVNVSVTNHPQRDVTLRVWGLEVPLRYVLAGTPTANSKNVLLLHGHSSRIEEVEHVITGLTNQGYVVLALDLPTNGYSGQLDHKHVLFAEEPRARDPAALCQGAAAHRQALLALHAALPDRVDPRLRPARVRSAQPPRAHRPGRWWQPRGQPRTLALGPGALGESRSATPGSIRDCPGSSGSRRGPPRASGTNRTSRRVSPHKRSYEGEDADRRR